MDKNLRNKVIESGYLGVFISFLVYGYMICLIVMFIIVYIDSSLEPNIAIYFIITGSMFCNVTLYFLISQTLL